MLFFLKLCMRVYLSFTFIFTYIHMGESLWHSIEKCSWSMQSNVWDNIHAFMLLKVVHAHIVLFPFYVDLYICMALSRWHSIGNCSWSMRKKVGRNLQTSLEIVYANISFLFLSYIPIYIWLSLFDTP